MVITPRFDISVRQEKDRKDDGDDIPSGED